MRIPGNRLVLASHNRKKTIELRDILAPLRIELASLVDFPGAPCPDETGSTFEENAIIKAKSALAFTGLPAVADDSGLVVGALGGEPGVRSARFAGETANDTENNLLLLKRLAGVAGASRAASFVSVIALALPDGEIRTYAGQARGRILEKARGEGGFGYDPLFWSDELGVTFAEADGEEKNRVSHRGKALGLLLAELRGASRGV